MKYDTMTAVLSLACFGLGLFLSVSLDLVERGEFKREVAEQCSSGSRQFKIGNNTYICAQVINTTLAELQERKRLYWNDQCSRHFMGMDNELTGG